MEMARNMMEAKHFPNEYWAEVVATVVYVMNRCPTGMNYSVSHLNFFGYVAYAHVPDELRKKLEKKGQKYIFLAILKKQKHTSCMIMSQGK